MSKNLITGYDINRDEMGVERIASPINYVDWMFPQYKEMLNNNTTRLPLPLEDESQTEWLYKPNK